MANHGDSRLLIPSPRIFNNPHGTMVLSEIYAELPRAIQCVCLIWIVDELINNLHFCYKSIENPSPQALMALAVQILIGPQQWLAAVWKDGKTRWGTTAEVRKLLEREGSNVLKFRRITPGCQVGREIPGKAKMNVPVLRQLRELLWIGCDAVP